MCACIHVCMSHGGHVIYYGSKFKRKKKQLYYLIFLTVVTSPWRATQSAWQHKESKKHNVSVLYRPETCQKLGKISRIKRSKLRFFTILQSGDTFE